MTNVSIDTPRPYRGIKALFRRAADALDGWARDRDTYTRMLAELQSMSDRELSYYGFHRSELPRIARNAVRDL